MITDGAAAGRGSGWSGVFALALGAFALVASEFLPVSLLTPVARALQVTEGQAGQSITISGVFAVLTSLSIAALAGRVDRKSLLAGLTLLMILSGSVAAFAPDYVTFMVGRALLGIAIGGFWSLSASVAMRLVSRERVPRALAIVNGGNALATVLAAPLGALLASIAGWRWAFFAVVPVAVIALAWQLRSLPGMTPEPSAQRANVFVLLKDRRVALGMAAVSVFFMGQFTLFTYLRPFLETKAGVGAGTLSLLLLVIGIAGVVGTLLIGVLLKQRLYQTLIAIPLSMAAIAIVLPFAAPLIGTTTILLALWGLVGTAAPVGWWTWLAWTLPRDAEAGGGLMVAVVQLAIGLGAGAGGLVFDRFGVEVTFGASAVLLVIAAGLALATSRVGIRNAASWEPYATDSDARSGIA